MCLLACLYVVVYVYNAISPYLAQPELVAVKYAFAEGKHYRSDIRLLKYVTKKFQILNRDSLKDGNDKRHKQVWVRRS